MTQPTSYTWPVIGTSPVIATVRAIDLNTLHVTFSEVMVLAEAINPSNYSLSGGLAVLNAVNINGNEQTYKLTTSDQTPGATYILTATGIHDRYGTLV